MSLAQLLLTLPLLQLSPLSSPTYLHLHIYTHFPTATTPHLSTPTSDLTSYSNEAPKGVTNNYEDPEKAVQVPPTPTALHPSEGCVEHVSSIGRQS